MKETVLLYNFTADRDRLLKVRMALLPLGVRIRTVGKEEYGLPVGVLAGVKDLPASAVENPGDFEDEMAVMAGFTSGKVDAFIQALRKKGVGRIDYKAILTPTNQMWDSVTLYRELKKEHEAMTGGVGPAE